MINCPGDHTWGKCDRDDCDFQRLPVEGRLKYQVCPICEGEGGYVNPAIDSQGLTAEDFEEDPDFREEYFAGTYDKRCECCKGLRVVTKEQLEEYYDRLDMHRTMMHESGEYGWADHRI